jgi:hypothetical protein
MIDFLLYCAIVLALATAFVALLCMREGAKYDDWLREFNETGINQPLAQILKGSEVVGHCEVVERRSHR